MNQIPSKIVVYHCRNLQLFEDGGQKEFARNRPGLKLVAIPCSGKVEAYHVLNAMAGGADGVLVLACTEEACQFFEGSMRSHKRMDYAAHWLEEIGIEPERVRFVHIPPRDLGALEGIVEEFNGKLKSFGSIPAE